ncbi:MAG: hypothetical protein ACRDFW_11630 [bacterium]
MVQIERTEKLRFDTEDKTHR